MSKSVSFLYRLARLANDVEKIKSSDPKKNCPESKKQDDRPKNY